MHFFLTAGAMRIPSSGKIPRHSKHYLTDFYGIERFQLPIQPFVNQTDKGYYYLYGHKIPTEGQHSIDISDLIPPHFLVVESDILEIWEVKRRVAKPPFATCASGCVYARMHVSLYWCECMYVCA